MLVRGEMMEAFSRVIVMEEVRIGQMRDIHKFWSQENLLFYKAVHKRKSSVTLRCLI